MLIFREVERHLDDGRVTDKKEEGYLNIKPNTDISVEEWMTFWDDLFKSMEQEP